MSKILIIDNYDSFTYNLYQMCGKILQNSGLGIEVIRNNELSLDEIEKRKYQKIIISPGPGSPENKDYFGVCSEVILNLGQTTPVLGICLGMQGICHFFGGKVVKAKTAMHGKTSLISHNNQDLFLNLPQSLEVMRYHSLVAEKTSLPENLEITAETLEGEIMGLKHKKYPIFGVQFHPESFATSGGMEIMKNFLLNSSN